MFAFICLEADQQKLFLELLTVHERFIVLSLNEQNPLPSFNKKHYFTVEDPLDVEVHILLTHIKVLNWQRIGLILITGDNGINQQYYSEMHNRFTNKLSAQHNRLCYFKDTVDLNNSTSVERIVSKLHSEFQTNVLILFGVPKDQIQLIKKTNVDFHTKHVWFTHGDSSDLLSMKHFPDHYNDLFVITFVTKLRRKILNNKDEFALLIKPQFQNYFVENGTRAELTFALTKYILWRFDRMFGQNSRYTRNRIYMEINKALMISQVVLLRENGGVERFEHFSKQMHFLEDKYKPYQHSRIHGTLCHKHSCSPGWEHARGKLLSSLTKWSYEFGHTCQKCQKGFIKATYGYEFCHKCPNYYQTNLDHTKCFDPYIDQFYTTNHMYYLTICFASIGVTLDLFILVVFIFYRDTPIAKSSDFILTAIHLITSLFINTGILFVRHFKPTLVLCNIDATTFGLFYTLFIAIVLTKSHKILRAFGSMRKLTTKNKRITIIQQYAIIIGLIVSVVLLTLVALSKDYPVVVSQKDPQKLLKYMFCRNQLPKMFQFGFSGLLQVATFIIAYRGRNLPDIFNESMSLLYASFASTMSFVVMFIVLYFGGKEDVFLPATIIWLAISLNSNIYILLCYGKKMYIILFNKEQNTRSFIQKRTFEFN
ncbi:metabotropic glutamate receptor 8-like [Clytia hemisphaerica]|uniref:metabotropic glutamate receptor 8-like n=1 Tax=Clytia hemisphaerica TaxID=252671 RepID=UPI0034D3B621